LDQFKAESQWLEVANKLNSRLNLIIDYTQGAWTLKGGKKLLSSSLLLGASHDVQLRVFMALNSNTKSSFKNLIILVSVIHCECIDKLKVR